MNKKNVYATAEERAAQYQKWGLQKLLSGLTLEERPEIMASLFLQAARYNGDEVALDYFKIIGQCYLDIEMFPFLESQEGVLISNCSRDQFQSNINEANSAIARKVIELYPQIAGFKKNEFDKYIKDDEIWGRGPSTAQLIETKKAMLQHVASQWRNTESDEEANNCFLLLWASYACVFFQEEKKICEDEIRGAAREGFPPARLVRHRLLLAEPNLVFAQFDDNRKALEKILLHAWVNNIGSEDATCLFRAVQPVLELEKDIFRHDDHKSLFYSLGRLAENIAPLFKAVKELIETLQSDYWSGGDIKISRLIEGRVALLIEVREDFSDFLPIDQYDEKTADHWFEQARNKIVEWCKKYRSYTVFLDLIVLRRNKDEKLHHRGASIYYIQTL